MTRPRSRKPLPKPHKRPTQDRSRFTVGALYDAFVRIWRRQGPGATGMRAVAAEAGYAVGTLYEYFPNREAMLSGYFRHCLDDLRARLRRADAAPARPWPERLRGLVAAALDERGEAPYFDADMLLEESKIADRAQHERAFAELSETWCALMRSWPDLPKTDDGELEALFLHLWGARRYAILLDRDQSTATEVDLTTTMLVARLSLCASAEAVENDGEHDQGRHTK